MRFSGTVGVFVVSIVSALAAAEPTRDIRFEVPADWKTERIVLPPSFAPQMKLKGAEEVRFAPGMFQPTSDSFLKWVEPFVTRRPQTLHLEVDVWASSKTSDRFLFACVSPQDKQAAIWKTMHELRATFLEANP